MALGDLMSSRFSQSSSAVSNHLDECSNHDDMDFVGQRRDRDFDTASSSYGNVTTTATSMAYLPQTIVLCDLRHEAFEDCVPAGPSDSGLVSKWRPKDRVSSFSPPICSFLENCEFLDFWQCCFSLCSSLNIEFDFAA
ncbi:hypothetical protein CsSME_00017657 [Camellia sinensis var. sinensis]